MIDVIVGCVVIATVYICGMISGAFAASQIMAGKDREKHEKEFKTGSGETEREE